MEFVPVTEESRELAPGDTEREYLAGEIGRLRKQNQEIKLIRIISARKATKRESGWYFENS